MRPYISLAVAAASLAAAQDLATALSDRPELSSLVELLGSVPNTTEFLAAQQDVTLFAPNNDALAMIVANGGIFNLEEAGVDAGLIEQILRYHFVRGVVQSTDATPSPQFLPTLLNYSGVVLDGEVSGSNVTGGQVVNVQLVDGAVNVIAGIKSAVQVVVAVSVIFYTLLSRRKPRTNSPRTFLMTTEWCTSSMSF